MTAPTSNSSEVIHGMKDYTTMTPREYSASRRSLPFGASMLQKASNPDWRKIGRGMIAAVDGDTGAPMICPGKVYAIEIHNGQIGFASYRRKPRDDEPYSYHYGRLCAVHGDYEIDRWPMTYDEMIADARTTYPTLWSPGPIDWYREYGLLYDETTGQVHNPLNLKEEQ